MSPPVYDPMHAAALLQPHIDAPPKLSELLTLRSATHAALARCDGGRTAHESVCVHAARSLAAGIIRPYDLHARDTTAWVSSTRSDEAIGWLISP